ncbi:hypothetical protein ESB00_17035 [Oleiharenicola lentus]|uniref:TonB-dependent receptor n=1 Tax=Oleiharenicola lentus TaxID=2508720 RepID=A0A4Q1C542_9BACT|nr:TonB-dependent receptor [Oleiharenicola lentus]RXK53399.1 hypothetical protein ESB00_17035 [Oleiharenicola lentus]
MNRRAPRTARRGFRRTFVCWISWVACGWAQQAAPAPTGLEEMSFEELANVTVTTVSKREERLFLVPAAVSVVTGMQIDESGIETIPEALRLAAGTAVARVNSREWGVSVRGFNAQYANKLLVLIDGRSIYTPLFGGTYWSMQSQPMEEVAQIEVVRGPGATVWGANAVNGVINVVTASAQDKPGSRVSATAGTEGWRGFARQAYGLKDGWASRYYVEHRELESTRALNGSEVRDDWRKTQAGFRADRKLAGKTELTLQGDLFQGEGGLTQPVVDMSAPGLGRIDTATGLHVRGFNLRGRVQASDNAGDGWFVQFWADHARREETLICETRTTWDLEMQRNLAHGIHQWTLGGGLRTSRDRTEGFLRPAFDPEDATLNLFSAFVQDEVTIGEAFRLTLGARLENHTYSDWELQPGARLLWKVSDRQVVWTAVSRAVRNPTRFDRGLRLDAAALPAGALGPGFPATLIRWQGSEGFRAETAVAGEAGWRMQPRPGLTIDAAAFLQDYGDGLEAVAGATFLPETFQGTDYLVWRWDLINRRPTTAYGGEFSFQYEPTARTRISGGYSFVRIEADGPAGGVNSNAVEVSTPRHTAFLDARVGLGRLWAIGAALRYFSGSGALPIPAVLSPELRVSWEPKPGLVLLLSEDNLADPQRPEIDSRTGQPISQIERRIALRISWQR